MKKAKMCYAGSTQDVDFNHKSKSPCFSSSASSFSRRSCMSKTPTSSSSSSAKGKRSVRFYPVSVILGEDSQNDPSLLPVSSVRKMTRVSSIKEVKKNSAKVKENVLMKGYQNSCKNNQFDFRGSYDHGEESDDDDDDDALSCSSSDLFELDHIVGAGRYQVELPVYETTNLERNKAIANGLCL
uniref:Uncharacterized protein n=2 Tax=Lotus japonicus TaxID=34305 RepID=I3S4K6_LOTJA|nr:unknown [Lotus japonicus]